MRTASGLKQLTYFNPGQLKYNYEYSIGKLKPDVIVQLGPDAHEAEPYLDIYTKLIVGEEFYYLRDGSGKVLWDLFDKTKN